LCWWTDRQTDRQTDMLIAMLRFPTYIFSRDKTASDVFSDSILGHRRSHSSALASRRISVI